MRAGTPGAAGGQVALTAVSPTSPKPRMDDRRPYLSVSGRLRIGNEEQGANEGMGGGVQTRGTIWNLNLSRSQITRIENE
jgi:hypothetical protein